MKKKTRVNLQGYLERVERTGKSGNNASWRNWWLIKPHKRIELNFYVPKEFEGKRIKIKIELIDKTYKELDFSSDENKKERD